MQLYARITVLGVEIRAKADNPRFLYMPDYRSEDALTLEGFGQALKHKRDREHGLWDYGN